MINYKQHDIARKKGIIDCKRKLDSLILCMAEFETDMQDNTPTPSHGVLDVFVTLLVRKMKNERIEKF